MFILLCVSTIPSEGEFDLRICDNETQFSLRATCLHNPAINSRLGPITIVQFLEQISVLPYLHLVARSNILASCPLPCETENAACPHLIRQIEWFSPQYSTLQPSFDSFSVCVRCSILASGCFSLYFYWALSQGPNKEFVHIEPSGPRHWHLFDYERLLFIVIQTCFCEKYEYSCCCFKHKDRILHMASLPQGY